MSSAAAPRESIAVRAARSHELAEVADLMARRASNRSRGLCLAVVAVVEGRIIGAATADCDPAAPRADVAIESEWVGRHVAAQLGRALGEALCVQDGKARTA